MIERTHSALLARIPKAIWWCLLIDMTILVLTSLPALWGQHLGGPTLLMHMAASGVMVVLVPLMVATFWRHGPLQPTTTLQWMFVAFALTCWLSIATMFTAMMPIAGTEMMHKIVTVHGWISYAAFAIAIGMIVTSMRSAKDKIAAPGSAK